MHATTLARHIEHGAIKEQITRAQERIITEGVDKAVQNQLDKITLSQTLLQQAAEGQELPAHYKTYAELGHDAERMVLQSVGIAPSHTQSAQYLSLTQINLEITPEVARLLRFHDDDEIIDVRDANTQ